MDNANGFNLSKWGDYHLIYAYGLQRGRRINRCSIEATGWLLLYCLAISDDYLIFPADPDECRLAAAPRRADLDLGLVLSWLDEVERHGLICRYQAEGETWAALMEAPPKRTKNGKRAARYPWPPADVATWDQDRHMWLPAAVRAHEASGALSTTNRVGAVRPVEIDNNHRENPPKGVSGESKKSKTACPPLHSPSNSKSISSSSGIGFNRNSGNARPSGSSGLLLLLRMGLPEKHPKADAVRRSGVSSAAVIALWADRGKQANNPEKPGRFLAKIIAEDGLSGVPSLSAKSVVGAVKCGVVGRCRPPGGQWLEFSCRKVQHGSDGLHVDGRLVVPAGQLMEAEYA
jgi:hypothetical protein